jgi:adenosylmethionine-8-amino-7-oxononanoate aminotransferase
VSRGTANIAILERDGSSRARDNGAYFLQQPATHSGQKIVGDVRGIGMWIAVEFTADRATKTPFTDDTAKEIVRRMKEDGVLSSGIGVSSLEMAPPLIAEREQLDRAVLATAQAVRAVSRERGLG